MYDTCIYSMELNSMKIHGDILKLCLNFFEDTRAINERQVSNFSLVNSALFFWE